MVGGPLIPSLLGPSEQALPSKACSTHEVLLVPCLLGKRALLPQLTADRDLPPPVEEPSPYPPPRANPLLPLHPTHLLARKPLLTPPRPRYPISPWGWEFEESVLFLVLSGMMAGTQTTGLEGPLPEVLRAGLP